MIGIQESKVADEMFPLEMIEALGYHPSFHGQKGHYGVALLSRLPPLGVVKGFPTDAEDAQRRAITGRFALPGGGEVTVINGYFPQGESRDHPVKFPGKQKFYADLATYLREHHSARRAADPDGRHERRAAGRGHRHRRGQRQALAAHRQVQLPAGGAGLAPGHHGLGTGGRLSPGPSGRRATTTAGSTIAPAASSGNRSAACAST
jgi:hypothetical protein